MAQKEFYTVQEVARMLAVSEDTIRRMLAAHKIPGHKVGTRLWRIPVAEYTAWLSRASGDAV